MTQHFPRNHLFVRLLICELFFIIFLVLFFPFVIHVANESLITRIIQVLRAIKLFIFLFEFYLHLVEVCLENRESARIQTLMVKLLTCRIHFSRTLTKLAVDSLKHEPNIF